MAIQIKHVVAVVVVVVVIVVVVVAVVAVDCFNLRDFRPQSSSSTFQSL